VTVYGQGAEAAKELTNRCQARMREERSAQTPPVNHWTNEEDTEKDDASPPLDDSKTSGIRDPGATMTEGTLETSTESRAVAKTRVGAMGS
jgi:hypothetical protein